MILTNLKAKQVLAALDAFGAMTAAFDDVDGHRVHVYASLNEPIVVSLRNEFAPEIHDSRAAFVAAYGLDVPEVRAGTHRIIHTDNFNGDYPDEKFVEGLPPMGQERALRIADAINHGTRASEPRFYRVVESGYQLQPGFEP